MKRRALMDEQWALIEPELPRSAARTGRKPRDRRLILDGIFWILHTGAPWRDLPERFGDYKKVHTRFSRWARSGVWARMFEHLADAADNEYAMIDSTIVRAHQHSAGAQKKTAKTKRSGAAKAD